MNKYTCIGYFRSDPEQPEVHLVEAADGPSAIDVAAREANDGKPDNPLDPYINTFVIAGHCEVLSSWAG